MSLTVVQTLVEMQRLYESITKSHKSTSYHTGANYHRRKEIIMAQTVHLRLEINGNDTPGESSVASLDRAGTIECSGFTYGVDCIPDEAFGSMKGKRQHRPVTITKRIDKTTPLLLKALCNNESVTKAVFRFFRPCTNRKAKEEHFYTIILKKAFISSIQQVSRDTILDGTSERPIMEEVSFVFREITWAYEDGTVTCEDT